MISAASIRCSRNYNFAALAWRRHRVDCVRTRTAHVRQQQQLFLQQGTAATSRQVLGVRHLSTLPNKWFLETAEAQNDQVETTVCDGKEDRPTVDNLSGHIDLVAENDGEYATMQQLQNDIEESASRQKEMMEPEEAIERKMLQGSKEELWTTEAYPMEHPTESTTAFEKELEGEEKQEDIEMEMQPARARRFHPLTLEGKFQGELIEILLPLEEMVKPLQQLLGRASEKHVAEAAEKAFGGRGLPLSPATPANIRTGYLTGVGLPPDLPYMRKIDADAFLAAYMPPVYASSVATLRETRKRLGRDWIQSRLKDGGPGFRVLDAGGGGGGLLAWDQIVRAEWELLAERGQVTGDKIPGSRTVLAGSIQLRERLEHFLHDTTLMPRLPDYMHSGKTKSGQAHLDSGGQSQSRKTYDVIIASHLFLKEKQKHLRKAILQNLWALLNEDGGVLVVVEKAHPRGFEAMAHARDTLLKEFLLPQPGQDSIQAENLDGLTLEPGRIIAPCTHNKGCPMYQQIGESRGRRDFCHFTQRFVAPKFHRKMLGPKATFQAEVEFSFFSVQRGRQRESNLDPAEVAAKAFAGYQKSKGGEEGKDTEQERPRMEDLPRILLPPLKRKGHVIIDVCSPEAKLERWTVPKSLGSLAFHDARKSKWGDLWALGAKTRVPRESREGMPEAKGWMRGHRHEEVKRQERKKTLKAKEPWLVAEDAERAERKAEARERSRMTKKEKAIEKILENERFE